jgi:predicted DNA-binding transcriptional regulator
MKQIAEILKAKSIQIPRNLLYNYKKLNINEMELIILIYILNSEDNTYNPREISNNLSIDMNEVLESVSDLTTKDIIKIEMVKKSNVRFE